MTQSVVTGLEVNHPRIKAAEQLILTLIGVKVLRPDKEFEISNEIFQIRLGIDIVKDHPGWLDFFTQHLRETRKWVCDLLDEMPL